MIFGSEGQSRVQISASIGSNFGANQHNWLSLRFSTATFIARCTWLCGYSRGIESFAEAKIRAKKAASILVDEVTRRGDVALVGHGFFNRMVGNTLQRFGWRLIASSGDGYGAVRTYGSPA